MKVQFVESAPRPLNDGVLYISDRFHTALHKCCCGCGREVVTPLNPAGWSYRRDGGTVTLKPSIGNWSFPCKSHYLIIRNEVVWARSMSVQQIAQVKAKDAKDRQHYIAHSNAAKFPNETTPSSVAEPRLSLTKHLFAIVRQLWAK